MTVTENWKEKLSDSQVVALSQIKELNEWMMNTLKIEKEDCWFIQGSLHRVTYHTLYALKEKGFLEMVFRGDGKGEYYRYTWKEAE